jgi:hypothetical protein
MAKVTWIPFGAPEAEAILGSQNWLVGFGQGTSEPLDVNEASEPQPTGTSPQPPATPATQATPARSPSPISDPAAALEAERGFSPEQGAL